MGNCCGGLGEMKHLISWESHYNPPVRLFAEENHGIIRCLTKTFTVWLKLFAVLMGCCWLESAELQSCSEAVALGRSLVGWGAQTYVFKKELSHIEDDFPCWGVSQWKQKVSRFGLDKPSRPFQLYYYIFSNNLKPTSQLVKREAISLLTFALHTLHTVSMSVLMAQKAAFHFRVKFQAAELLTTSNCHLCLVTSDLSPHPVLCSQDLSGPVQGDSDLSKWENPY